MFRRHMAAQVEEALGDTPVVALVGARQTGKTTLVQNLAGDRPGARYVTLDDATTLAAATADPTSFVRQGGRRLLVIDEVQKATELLPALKVEVDGDRRPGRFLLTGSAHVLALPRVSESLAGRMEILELRPLSQGELEGTESRLIDHLFSEDWEPEAAADASGLDLADRVLRGGYPEAVRRRPGRRRDAWFAAYVTAILQRDVRELANIEGLTQMPRLLSVLAARSASLTNKAELSRATGFPYTTLERYLALLEATFLLEPLPAWSTNLTKRLVRSSKVVLCDSGLAAHLVGADRRRWRENALLKGALTETFVIGELRKQAGWSEISVRLSHFRSGRQEVDIVLEDRSGRVVGVEVKAGASLRGRDVAGLRGLAEATGKGFLRGVILYAGQQAMPLGAELWALPISALWQGERGK